MTTETESAPSSEAEKSAEALKDLIPRLSILRLYSYARFDGFVQGLLLMGFWSQISDEMIRRMPTPKVPSPYWWVLAVLYILMIVSNEYFQRWRVRILARGLPILEALVYPGEEQEKPKLIPRMLTFSAIFLAALVYVRFFG